MPQEVKNRTHSEKPVVIMGPTASGKTELALELAKKLGGEIISADSRQVFKYLSAGTAKPDGEWKSINEKNFYMVDSVPYHLVDIIDPMLNYDAGSFVHDANALLDEITRRQKLPIIVGGTGLYIQALFSGLDVLPKSDSGIRQELAEFARKHGSQALHEKLKEIDLESAKKIPSQNIQRTIRAIEVYKLTGQPISKLQSGKFYNALPVHLIKFVILTWNKARLVERIKKRTLENFDKWVAETRKLLNEGYPEDCPGLKSLGYSQIIDYINGKKTSSETIHNIVQLTISYAKRQMTWFNRYRNVFKLNFENAQDFKIDKICQMLCS